MCELLEKNSLEVAGALLEDNILIKDLTSKIHNGKQYIRLAIRTEEENNMLAKKLKNILELI